mgnify:CR=1 FL=1
MKRKKTFLVSAFLLALCSSGAQAQMADNGKRVKRITFDREQVNVIYADGTSDMGVTEVGVFNDKSTVGIARVEGVRKTAGGCFNLSGQRVSTSVLRKGLYVVREGERVRKIIKK